MIGRIAFLAGTVFVALLAASQSASMVFEKHRPALATLSKPANGRSEGFLAGQLLAAEVMAAGGRMPKNIPPAVAEHARHALKLDPTSAESVRLLALAHAEAGDRATGRRLMELALAISKRDAGANIWLSEDAARRGDTQAAFGYYDRTLRVSPASAETLLPAMANALADDRLIDPLAQMLRRQPPWAADLWGRIVRTPGIALNAARLRMAVPNRGIERDAEIDRQLLTQLVESGQFEEAVDLYRSAVGSRPSLGPETFTFEKTPEYPPIEWQTVSEGGYSAVVDPPEAMAVSVMSGAHGVIARKLMRIEPGSYRIAGEVDGLPPAAELAARLRCASSSRRGTAPEVLLGNGSSEGILIAPSGCTYYWLELEARGPTDGSAAADFTLKKLAIAPA